MTTYCGQLYVKIIKARGIRSDLSAKALNPMITVSILGDFKNEVATKYLKSTMHPEWHQEFILAIPSLDSICMLKLLHKRTIFRKNIEVGSKKLDLKKFSRGRVFEGWIRLDSNAGEIQVVIHYNELTLEHNIFTMRASPLRLALKRAIFYPGQKIIGCVVHNVTKPHLTKGLKILLEGVTHTFWSEPAGTYEVAYKATRVLFRNFGTLFAPPPSLPTRCYTITGSHYYPFEYLLPMNLPPSMAFGSGSIEYSIKIFDGKKRVLQQNLWILARPPVIPPSNQHYYSATEDVYKVSTNWNNKTGAQRFNGLGNALKQSVGFGSSSPLSNSGPIGPAPAAPLLPWSSISLDRYHGVGIYGDLPQIAFTGEPLNISLTLINGTSKPVTTLTVFLYFTLTVRGTNSWVVGYVEKRWTPKKVGLVVIENLDGFPVPPRTIWQGNVSLMIPEHLAVTLENSPLLMTQWDLRLMAQNVVKGNDSGRVLASVSHPLIMATRNREYPDIKPPSLKNKGKMPAPTVNVLGAHEEIWRHVIPIPSLKKQKPIPSYGYSIPSKIVKSGTKTTLEQFFQP